MHFFKLIVVFVLAFSLKVQATHIIGGEIGYTHITGNTYEITLTLYGDCAGNAFPTLPNAVPRIEIYKNGAPFHYIDLSLTGPGVEVTPVCPSEAGNTSCVNNMGILPGVMRFIFKGDIVLDGPAVKWSFLFNSSLGGNSGAGRTNAITNIASGTLMVLEATLNNTVAPNNSSVFTTIPTPFFCLNIPQEFNQGAVDPDGDQLTFSLVPGLHVDNSGTLTSVTYISPYSYTNPLATLPGSFNFNTTSGQMSFLPNLVQTSLVVNKVIEMRGGIEVGSCMREMNLVVLNNCNNQSPTASIPTTPAGGFDSNRIITICNATVNPQFVIQVTDPDLQNVDVTVNGLPATASYTIIGNGTPSPQVTINWNTPQPMVPGVYNFYINCQDDGCPLSSKQTFAYTVIQIQPIDPLLLSAQNESCVPGMDGSISVSASSLYGGLSYSMDGVLYQTDSAFLALQTGTYTVTVMDSKGCTLTSSTVVGTSPLPVLNTVTTPESCMPGQDGTILVIASSVNGPIISYTINGGAPQSTATFSGLISGNYTITATDNIGCKSSQTVVIDPAVVPVIDSLFVNDITCFGKSNGRLRALISPAGISTTSYLYPGSVSSNNGTFSNLEKGSYTVIVISDMGCSDTAYASIQEPPKFEITDIRITDATCDRDNGMLTIETNFPPPLIYTLRPATFINTSGIFTDIAPGVYTVIARDTNFCTVDSVVEIKAAPNVFQASIVHKNLDCNGIGYEGEAEVFASGGVEPYQYAWTTNPSSTAKRISNLYYGWYVVQVTDASGCSLRKEVYIEPGDCCEKVYAPNAFTPNGDGQNDVWKLITSSGLTIQQFAVYNRWGEKVWSGSDQRNAWNGTFNGQPVPVGAYFYVLRYTCLSDGKSYLRKGDITVLY
jgi:gliding motility-associated-like protein